MDDFFDFDYPFRGYQRANTESLMKTDIKEHEHGYELEVSLPGYKKEDIRRIKDGYLTIQAAMTKNNDQKDEKTGNYILEEKDIPGSCSRSFYVGKDITQKTLRQNMKMVYLFLQSRRRIRRK